MLTKRNNANQSEGAEMAAKWLKSNGFYEVRIEDGPDASALYIEADGNKGTILVKVKIAKTTSESEVFTNKDYEEVKGMATKKQMDPWTAIVFLDSKNHLHSIKWNDLSKS